MSAIEKFDRLAPGYAAHDYADPSRYAARRAEIALRLGPALPPGATVLDLACGDANMAGPFLARGYRYRGVDGSAGMIEEARRRLGDAVPLEVAGMDEYVPPETVDLTLCLRAFYYPKDRAAFLRRAAAYTRVKLVFDFDPRVQDRDRIVGELRENGFERIELRPFFLPQRLAPPAPVRAALRVRGIWFCAATPSASPART